MTRSYEDRPIVLVTREEPEPVSQAVRLAGGEAVEVPLLVTRWLDFEIPEGRALEDYDWVAFTSVRALQAIAKKADTAGWSWPPQVACAAVGNRTAHELQAHGWMPQCISDEASASGLVDCLQARGVSGARVLFPCSAIAEPTFAKGMRDAGARVDVVPVYTTETPWTRSPEEKSALASRIAQALERGCVPTCASPSAARALVEIAQAAQVFERLQRTPVVVIGPTTGRAVDALGLQSVDAGGRSLACLARKAVEIGRARKN
jgi:uroporphyrinogen III methyltransferase/synthase